jgi:drug/metabolite transporter (DMT)-like permease
VSAIFGAYALDEPITVNLVLGLLLVAIGILVASLNAERDDGPDVVINQSVQLMRLN